MKKGQEVKITNGEHSGKFGVIAVISKAVGFFGQSTITVRFGNGSAVVMGNEVEIVK